LLTPKQQRYYIANPQQPVSLFVPPASWLRIDRLGADGQLHSNYHYQPAQQAGRLQLSVQQGQSETLYRAYRWQRDEAYQVSSQVLAKAAKPALPPIKSLAPEAASPMLAFDYFNMAEQEDGSWGFTTRYHDRRNYDEDSRTDQERFIEQSWNYRLKHNRHPWYWRSDVALRVHDGAELSTLLTRQYGLWRQSRYWDLEADFDVYYQLDAKDSEAKGEWAAYAAVTSTWHQYWNSDLENRIRLRGFGRELSVDEDRPMTVDDDVHSGYKVDHRHGLLLSDELIYRPWLDSEFRAGFSVTSNEDLALWDADSHSLMLGAAQYYRPFVASIGYRQRQFLSDDDRNNSDRSDLLDLRLLWEHWNQRGDLLQVGARFNYDLDDAEASFSVGISWNRTEGQGFDDIAPTELRFNSLRQQQTYLKVDSNRLLENSHE
jgi:hypothetical protein